METVVPLEPNVIDFIFDISPKRMPINSNKFLQAAVK